MHQDCLSNLENIFSYLFGNDNCPLIAIKIINVFFHSELIVIMNDFFNVRAFDFFLFSVIEFPLSFTLVY